MQTMISDLNKIQSIISQIEKMKHVCRLKSMNHRKNYKIIRY